MLSGESFFKPNLEEPTLMAMTGSLFRCALLVVGLLFCACSMVGSSRPIVIQGGTLIDGTGRAAIADSVIVIRNGKFAAVGKRGDVAIPQDAEVIDAKGKTLLPGLIDGHCHYRDWMGELYLAYGVVTASASAWVKVPALTAASSLSFSAAARSACRAARISASAVVTFASSTPSFSASAFANAASRAARVRTVLRVRPGGRLVLLPDGLQRLGHLRLGHPELAGQFLGQVRVVRGAVAVPPGPVGLPGVGAPDVVADGVGAEWGRPRRGRRRRSRHRAPSLLPRRQRWSSSWWACVLLRDRTRAIAGPRRIG